MYSRGSWRSRAGCCWRWTSTWIRCSPWWCRWLGTASGERRLIVDPRCKELIKDFEQVTYKENSMIVDKDRDPRRTHLSDAFGYLVWQECGKRGTVGERGMPLW